MYLVQRCFRICLPCRALIKCTLKEYRRLFSGLRIIGLRKTWSKPSNSSRKCWYLKHTRKRWWNSSSCFRLRCKDKLRKWRNSEWTPPLELITSKERTWLPTTSKKIYNTIIWKNCIWLNLTFNDCRSIYKYWLSWRKLVFRLTD